MSATLYVIPGSHPSMAARLMLEHKGIDYRRVDLMPVVSRGVLRMLRFPGPTVPALRLDGRRIQTSRQISRALDDLRPQPPLFPGDAAEAARVEEAERWGDEILQAVPRRILWWSFRRNREALGSFAAGARLGVPIGLAVKTGGPLIRVAGRINSADDDTVRADLAALPEMLQQVDDWIADGRLGGQTLNAADFQIAPSVRLLLALDDLKPAMADRPLASLARRVVPVFPGRVPPVLPQPWLAPLAR